MTKQAKPVIWVLGATSGIGKETAKEFARTGATVYASSRRAKELDRLKAELKEEELTIKTAPCNIASWQNVEQLVKKHFSKKIDCLVNCAGVTSFRKAEENSMNEIYEIVNTNLLGSVHTIKAVLPTMIKQAGGMIINVGSVVAKKIFLQSSAYSASKAGLLAYSRVLREEVREYGIRVVDILPGATETSIWPAKVRESKAELMMSPEDVARIIVSTSFQRSNLVSEEITLRPITGDL